MMLYYCKSELEANGLILTLLLIEIDWEVHSKLENNEIFKTTIPLL